MGEEGISISDTKEVKIDGVFDDVDLLSEEEKAAMAEDTDDAAELARKQAAEDDKAKAAAEDETKAKAAEAEAAKKAQEEADAKKAKQIEEADAKVAEEKAKAEREAKEATAAASDKDKAGETGAEAGSQDAADTGPQIVVPPSTPPLAMQSLTPEQVEETKKGLEDAHKRFSEGEIDFKEYSDERLLLEKKLWQHDIAVQITTDSIENQWQFEQQHFLSDPQNAWINDDDVVYGAFSSLVNSILASEDGSVMPGPQILAQAREQVSSRFSPTKAEDDEAAKEAAAKDAALKRAKTGQANKQIPDTLGGVPPAEQEEGSGEFDWIDKLDGEAYEQAVEKLTAQQLERYENSH